MYSVAEFAGLKGISPARVRALVASGDLPAQKVGNSYVIDELALRWNPRSCRPLSDAMRSQFLRFLAGDSESISPQARARIRGYVARVKAAQDPAKVYVDLLSGRAAPRRYECHREDVYELRQDPRVVAADASINEFQMVSGGIAHLEIRPELIDDIAAEYLMVPARRGNVWLWAEESPVSDPMLFAIANLYVSGGVRERASANRVLLEVLGQV